MSIFLPPRFQSGGIPFCSIPLTEWSWDSTVSYPRYIYCQDVSDDGLHYLFGRAIDQTITVYNATTNPWDLATLRAGTFGQYYPDTSNGGPIVNGINIIGIQWMPGGHGFISSHYETPTSHAIARWSLDTPYTFGNLTAPTPVIEEQRSLSGILAAAGATRVEEFRINPDNGQQMMGEINDSSGSIAEFYMSTPWDLSTISYVRKWNPGGGTGKNFQISPDGKCVYRSSGRVINQYILDGDPWEAVLNSTTPSQSKTLTEIPATGGSASNNQMDSFFIGENRIFAAQGVYGGSPALYPAGPFAVYVHSYTRTP